MIAAARQIARLDRELRAGRWTRAQDGIELFERTIGLVGFGQIGQRVARVCLAIGMKVVAFDPAFAGTQRAGDVELAGALDGVLARSDVLSLHVPLTPRTRGMIGAAQLALMPRGSILVNTARGTVNLRRPVWTPWRRNRCPQAARWRHCQM
jgi:D-3-phosphoglycerate dehydrogenase